MPEVVVEIPSIYRVQRDILEVRHEEEALCWLWAFPYLLGWPAPVTWLYTPVVGNRRWPGDLWGVDDEGNLLIVECKQCKQSDDPFKDFVAFHRHEARSPSDPSHHRKSSSLLASSWLSKFPKHLKAELQFADGASERPAGKTDGILPRSNKRKHIRLWRHLSLAIDKQIRGSDYKSRALKYLEIRAAKRDPAPYYIGLMVVSSQRAKTLLTSKAIGSARELIRMVGLDHVRAVSIRAVPCSEDKVRVIADELTPFIEPDS